MHWPAWRWSFRCMMLMQQMANCHMGGAIAAAIARAIGAGRREDAASLVIHALVIASGAAALFSAVFLLGGPGDLRPAGRSRCRSWRPRSTIPT